MKKFFAILLSSVCAVSMISSINISADENIEQPTTCDSESSVYSAGLISRFEISITSDENKILLSGKTLANDTMRYVGLKNIKIQRSSNGTDGWSDYITDIDDLLSNSDTVYNITDYELRTVPRGYYYRVVLDHYAQKHWLIGPSESIYNTSNSVRIP